MFSLLSFDLYSGMRWGDPGHLTISTLKWWSCVTYTSDSASCWNAGQQSGYVLLSFSSLLLPFACREATTEPIPPPSVNCSIFHPKLMPHAASYFAMKTGWKIPWTSHEVMISWKSWPFSVFLISTCCGPSGSAHVSSIYSKLIKLLCISCSLIRRIFDHGSFFLSCSSSRSKPGRGREAYPFWLLSYLTWSKES